MNYIIDINRIFMLFEDAGLTNAERFFQFDYIYFDAIFLAGWVLWLLYNKRFSALKAGIIFGLIIYFIDAGVWWNLPAGAGYPTGTFVREYWIGIDQVPHQLGDLLLLKFGADFMMTISYGIFVFTWVWLVFEFWKGQLPRKKMIFATGYWLVAWFLTPWLSIWTTWNDVIVHSVRHMETQFVICLINLILGYTLLIVVARSGKFGAKEPWKKVGYIFLMGMSVAFAMEFPLYIAGIRPINGPFLIYETIFLFNQGAPYLWVMSERIFPYLTQRWNARKSRKST
jgi:hypothetical protein